MAYSDNLDAFVDQWLLCPPFSSSAADDTWFSDADADAVIAQALTVSVSVSSADNSNSLSDILTPVPSSNADTPRGAQSISACGSGSGFGSDHETNSKMKRSVPGPASGRIGKRKPRASKKSPTTFITADAANFRQMVQDVTGVKLPTTTTTLGRLSAVVKPEPQRFGAGGGLIHGCLPTLDTSAFLIDRHNRQQALVAPSGAGASQPPVGEIGGAAGGVGGVRTGFDFDGFSCFPTLESWKVM